MSILKILENSKVDLEEFEFLVSFLKKAKENSELSIKKFNDAETMLKAINIVHPDFDKDEKVLELKNKAQEVLEGVEKELKLLDRLIKKLDL